MKSFHNQFIQLLIVTLSLSTIFLSSCTKEKGCTDPKALNYNPDAKESDGNCKYAVSTPSAKATFNIDIHQHFGASDMDTSTIFTLTTGQRFRMSTIRYYLSNFRLVKADNSEVSIPESYLLIQPSIGTYSLGEVEPGTYTKIKFFVGIDSVTNSGGTMPVDRPAGHPLGLQNPSMFWSWSTGYIFMKFEGLADTLPTGTLNQNFSWHVGTNEMLRTVEIPLSNLTLTAGQTSEIHIKSDLNELLKYIDFRTDLMTHTMGNRELATKISDKVTTMFSVE